MLLYSVAMLAMIIAEKNLIDADPDNVISANNKRTVVFKFWWWIALNQAICYWITHWMFAYKYWTLAVKFEKIKKG